MGERSGEKFLVGETVKRKLIVSHLLSSLVPFIVILYLFLSYLSPRMPGGVLNTAVLVAIFIPIGVLVFIGYYLAWDIGHVLAVLARNAEAKEGFGEFAARGDEIGAIMRSFSQTLEALRRRTDEVNLFSTKLEAANQELGQMNRRLRELSYMDDLTGVHNRRYFNLALEEEVHRSERYHRRFCLAILDLDHFKIINDEHGHANGDRVLAEVGRILKENTRTSDVVCRFGGEEFAMVIPETAADKAMLLAEKLLQGIRSLEFTFDGSPAVKITASVGVSVYPEAGRTSDELLSSADRALYRAKVEGRDRVCVREEPVN